MNKNLTTLLKAAVVSGFVAGSVAYADEHNTPPAEGATPKAEGEKKPGKGQNGKHAHRHAKGDKKGSGCQGKDGCGGSADADKKEEAPK